MKIIDILRKEIKCVSNFVGLSFMFQYSSSNIAYIKIGHEENAGMIT